MANWIWTLDIKDAWEASKRGEITTYALAQKVAAALKEAPVHLYFSASALAALFSKLPEDVDVDAFDALWERLYNWADDERVWVKAF